MFIPTSVLIFLFEFIPFFISVSGGYPEAIRRFAGGYPFTPGLLHGELVIVIITDLYERSCIIAADHPD
jgi:hypothetical protein